MSKPSTRADFVARSLPHVYSEYDPPPDAGIDCSVLPSMTQQNFRDECDINNIMKRYQATGLLDDSNDVGQFADVASAVDYHTAQNLIAQANETFLDLPLKVRRRFANDPVQFLQFVDSLNDDNPAAIAEARDLGLLKPLEDSLKGGKGDATPPAPSGAGAPKGPEGAPKGQTGAS